MIPVPASPARVRWGRWTPARLIVLGALLGFGAPSLNAALSLTSSLAILQGALDAVPYEAVLLDAALMALLVPVGLFLVVCGLALHLRAQHPPGRSIAFRAALGGAFLYLTAGLLSGLLNFSVDVVPLPMFTLDFMRNLVVVGFVATVTAAAGLLIALCGLAALVGRDPDATSGRGPRRLRLHRRKTIYQGAPSAR